VNRLSSPAFVIDTADMLKHWQGHRRVTRRVIDAFPESDLLSYSIGGMRPFAGLAFELASMASAGVRGLVTRDWSAPLLHHTKGVPDSKRALLDLWDRVTVEIDHIWPELPVGRFEEIDKAFGTWEGQMSGIFLYWLDNENHHRGQGYVYLRALGIEPPAFYDRD
jgi:uncharacterized damage-inducible protein DinB